MDRLKVIYSTEKNMYLETSPVLFKVGALIFDTQLEVLMAQFKVINLDENVITGMKLVFSLWEDENKLENHEYEYKNIKVFQGDEFGQKTPIRIKKETANRLIIENVTVCFENGDIWESTDAWNSYKKISRKEQIDKKIIDHFGTDAKYSFVGKDDLWVCLCGSYNNKVICYKCKRNKVDIISFFQKDYDEIDNSDKKNDSDKSESPIVASKSDSKKRKEVISKIVKRIKLVKNSVKKININNLKAFFKAIKPKYYFIFSAIIAAIMFLVYLFFSPRTVSFLCIHNKTEATCLESSICVRCKKTFGEPLGHNWKEADCENPKTCINCGLKEGYQLFHQWEAATCTEAQYCTVCGKAGRGALGHVWNEATCYEPRKCRTCGITKGSELGHNWTAATCQGPSRCTRCIKTKGSALKHVIENYKCKLCGKDLLTRDDVKDIIDIVDLRYEINYLGGITQYMVIRNKSADKTINYITFSLKYFNAVGDEIADEIRREKGTKLLFTGPLGPGEKSVKTEWLNNFYNKSFSGTMHFEQIEIQYSDGSVLIIPDEISSEAVVAWR